MTLTPEQRLRALLNPKTLIELDYAYLQGSPLINSKKLTGAPTSSDEFEAEVYRTSLLSSLAQEGPGLPIIGFFWFQVLDGGSVFLRNLKFEIRDADYYGKYIIPRGDESIYWEGVMRQVPEWREKEIHEVPCGRVIFSRNDSRFKVMLPKSYEQNANVQDTVRNVFGLKKDQTDFYGNKYYIAK